MNEQGFIPLYSRLYNYYQERIARQEYQPGERIDSINRIMSRHRVSRETAKLVLNKLSENGLIVKKAGKGSFVSYTRTKQKIWGIVIPFFSTNIEELIGFLDLEAKASGREIRYFLHYNDPGEEMKLVGSMVREGFEAVIVVPNYDESMTAGFYRNLNHGNSALVLVDNTMVGSFFNYVIQSYDLGVKRAVNYLTSGNTGNLLFIKNDSWRGKNLVQELMEESLRLFISRQSLKIKLHVISGLMNFEKDLLRKNNISGILCSTDIDSLKVTGRLETWDMHLPDEISLVSYGNTELTQYATPPLTVIDCNYKRMAKLTAMLINNYDKKQTLQFVIEPELIVRGT